ncbi:hypothetical protein DVH24_000019 [Malus domestica]|uniref:RING-type E3 ubiquitin transferase n=1 Tax=Malus domestica TaxID=3750 RepID=A0A498IYU1_MALDO|nr:hypothetical protein DVH24_000019 [Malus domestica]
MSRIVRGQGEKREESVAVAIDKDKGSEHAIKWAVDHLLARGQPLTLLHAPTPNKPKGSFFLSVPSAPKRIYQDDFFGMSVTTSLSCLKQIKCNEVVIKDTDIPNAIIDYVMVNTIEILVLGTPSKSRIFRFKLTDVPSTVSKRAPDFCSVYVIGKGKVSYMRCATSTPQNFAQRSQVQHQPSTVSEATDLQHRIGCSSSTRNQPDGDIQIKSPFARGRPSMDKSYELSPETDISFVSSGRPSIDRMSPRCDFGVESGMNSRLSIGSDGDNRSPTSSYSRHKFLAMGSLQCEMSSCSIDSGKSSSSSQNMDDVESEMRRLKLELKQTMEMYSTACKEALIEKHKEVALALVGKEKAKCKAAIEAAEAAQRIAELEAQKRRVAEMKALKESEEKNKALQARSYDLRYRKYTIQEIEKATNDFSQDRNIGGGYGPVYRGELDHTPVAIKILRPDAAQGQSQFKQETPHKLTTWSNRLVPPSVANAVTQYHMTSTAGTFCYIDPEYQQTGLLGTKSDIYSLGVMFLQLITAKPPMGLTHHVEQAIETGTFAEMLDPAVPDWPVEEALKFAKLYLQRAEMRRKDRPDLGKVVLPELNRLRALADESLNCVMLGATGVFSPRQHSNPSIQVSCIT